MTILLKHTTTRFGLLLLLALVLSSYHTSCLRVLIEDTLPLYRVFVKCDLCCQNKGFSLTN